MKTSKQAKEQITEPKSTGFRSTVMKKRNENRSGAQGTEPENVNGRSTVMERTNLLTPDQVATYLGVARHTLANWRTYGTGPEYMKVGRQVRYQLEDLIVWLEGQRTSALTALATASKAGRNNFNRAQAN